MIIFGRWSVWLLIALVIFVLFSAFAAQHPTTAIGFAAITAILAIYAWRGRSSD
jgi:hypothetical protein